MKHIVLCDGGFPDKVLPLCERYQLGIEFQSFVNPNDRQEQDEKITRHRAAVPAAMESHLHAPYHDLCLGSQNREIVRVTREYFDYAYDVAEKLGCLSMTVHHGYVPNTSYPENWIKRAALFWRAFLEDHPGDMHINMENQLEHGPDMLMRLVDAMADERLKLNLDIGHAHCHSRFDVKEWIIQLNERIHYVHIHQNNGQTDEHLGLQQGSIMLDPVFDALEKYAPDAVWALECRLEDMEVSVECLKDRGYL